MNNKVVYCLYHCFVRRGFSVLRFNFRGVGRSQGTFDNGKGELADAAAALDWLQAMNPTPSLLGGGLFLRRLDRHAAPDAPARRSTASSRWRRRPTSTISRFLAPCPSSGLIIGAETGRDRAACRHQEAGRRLSLQRDIAIESRTIGRQPLLPQLARQARSRCRQVCTEVPDHAAADARRATRSLNHSIEAGKDG